MNRNMGTDLQKLGMSSAGSAAEGNEPLNNSLKIKNANLEGGNIMFSRC